MIEESPLCLEAPPESTIISLITSPVLGLIRNNDATPLGLLYPLGTKATTLSSSSPKPGPSLPVDAVVFIGVDVDVIKENRDNAGGGQYLIKNTNSEMWDKIYRDSILLYDQMLDYQRRFPISPGEIQFWTSEMWSLLWNLWLYDHKTIITKELDFSWATDNLDIYEQRPILHMAGVTDDLKNTKFYKGDYINVDPIEKLKETPNHFDYVDPNSSTIKYIENMKSYIQKYNI